MGPWAPPHRLSLPKVGASSLETSRCGESHERGVALLEAALAREPASAPLLHARIQYELENLEPPAADDARRPRGGGGAAPAAEPPLAVTSGASARRVHALF